MLIFARGFARKPDSRAQGRGSPNDSRPLRAAAPTPRPARASPRPWARPGREDSSESYYTMERVTSTYWGCAGKRHNILTNQAGPGYGGAELEHGGHQDAQVDRRIQVNFD